MPLIAVNRPAGIDQITLRIVLQFAGRMRQETPYFLRYERHKRMQHFQHVLKSHDQNKSCYLFVLLVITPETFLDYFYVPVAVLVPDQVIYPLSGHSQIELIHSFRHILNAFIDPADHPLVLIFKGYVTEIISVSAGHTTTICTAFSQWPEVVVFILNVHNDESGCVPEFVGKVSGSYHSLVLITHIVARGYARSQHESQSVGSVFVYLQQRIYAVAEGFAHFSALGVSHEAVNIYILKRWLAHGFAAGEYHSYYPEEYDVIACYQNVGRIEIIQIFSLVRPAQC